MKAQTVAAGITGAGFGAGRESAIAASAKFSGPIAAIAQLNLDDSQEQSDHLFDLANTARVAVSGTLMPRFSRWWPPQAIPRLTVAYPPHQRPSDVQPLRAGFHRYCSVSPDTHVVTVREGLSDISKATTVATQ